MVRSADVIREIERFRELQVTYREYGSCDTEPDTIFAGFLHKLLECEEVRIPGPEGWQLYYSSMSDAVEIGRDLTNQACKIRNVLEDMPVRELRAVRKYFNEEYGWRVS